MTANRTLIGQKNSGIFTIYCVFKMFSSVDNMGKKAEVKTNDTQNAIKNEKHKKQNKEEASQTISSLKPLLQAKRINTPSPALDAL